MHAATRNRAASYLADPTLGLRLGQTITPRHAGILGYVLLASRDLQEALQRLDRYQRLVYDVTPMEWRDGSSYVDLSREGTSKGGLLLWSPKRRSPGWFSSAET